MKNHWESVNLRKCSESEPMKMGDYFRAPFPYPAKAKGERCLFCGCSEYSCGSQTLWVEKDDSGVVVVQILRPCSSFKPVAEKQTSCTCDSLMLTWQGCTCGYFRKEKQQ